MQKLLLSFFLFFTSLNALSEPIALYLTWEKDPTTTQEIFWITKDEETDVLEVKGEAETAYKKIEGRHHPLQELKATLHQVSLKGLTPNSPYSFKLAERNEVYRFRTLAEGLDKPFSFVVGGDVFHDAEDAYIEMLKTVSDQNPFFIVMAGDLAYSFLNKEATVERSERWLPFFKGITHFLKNKEGEIIPILTAIGNHDVKGSFNQTPKEASYYYTFFPWEGYREVDFGQYLSLFILDSAHTHPIEGDQTAWLKQALEKNQNVLYKFAIYHVPGYPSVRPFEYVPSTKIRNNWVPLFETFGLTAAFEHHDHALKRTFPLKNGAISPKDGVVYFGDGSLGVSDPRPPRKGAETWYLAKAKQAQGVWLVTLSKEQASFKALSVKGAILDQAQFRP